MISVSLIGAFHSNVPGNDRVDALLAAAHLDEEATIFIDDVAEARQMVRHAIFSRHEDTGIYGDVSSFCAKENSSVFTCPFASSSCKLRLYGDCSVLSRLCEYSEIRFVWQL